MEMRHKSDRSEFSILEELLLTRQQQGPIYYYHNPGNWGDALIRFGTLLFFQDIGLRYTEVKSWKRWAWLLPRLRGGTLLFGGGGAWSNYWPYGFKFVSKQSKYFHSIVLPSTFADSFDIANVIYFCRDEYESKTNMPDSIFCHDMAFYAEDWIARRRVPSPKGIGNFFRTDREKLPSVTVPKDNVDLSALGNHMTPIESFVDKIAHHQVINTDRLHVAIAASCLGCETNLYPSDYFKSLAIYRSSISKRYPKTHFQR